MLSWEIKKNCFFREVTIFVKTECNQYKSKSNELINQAYWTIQQTIKVVVW